MPRPAPVTTATAFSNVVIACFSFQILGQQPFLESFLSEGDGKRTYLYMGRDVSSKVMSRAPRWKVVKYTNHWNPTTRRLRKLIKNMRYSTSHMNQATRPARRSFPIATMP